MTAALAMFLFFVAITLVITYWADFVLLVPRFFGKPP